MTDDLLTETLHHRADRADPAPDADQLLATVQDLAEWRQRRRRTAVAASSGIGLIAALVAGIVVLGPGQAADNHQQVGGQPSRTQSNPAPSSTGPTAPYLGPVRTTPALLGPSASHVSVAPTGSAASAAASAASAAQSAASAAASSARGVTPTDSNAPASSTVGGASMTAARPTTSGTP